MLRISIKDQSTQNSYLHRKSELVVGRTVNGPGAIRVNDPYVSGRHLVLEELPDQRVRIESLGRNASALSDGRTLQQGEFGFAELPLAIRIANITINIDVYSPPVPADTANDGDPIVGHEIDGFQLLERIGQGSMGVVYKAFDLASHQTVALKYMKGPGESLPKSSNRFEREAEAITLLDHPNIVPILHSGTVKERSYLAMEYMPGGNLEQRVPDDAALDPVIAADLVCKIADAAYYSHTKNVIHRDLKPANILVNQLGTPYVADFGLAKILDADITITKTGDILGTPGYMSPEQAMGCKVDHAADIYAIGGILFRLLTGQHPNESLANLLDPAYKPPSIRAYRNDVPFELDRICDMCLRQNPKHRYATVAELRRDLEKWLRTQATRHDQWKLWIRYCAGERIDRIFSRQCPLRTLVLDDSKSLLAAQTVH